MNQSLLYPPAIHAKNTEDPIPFLATLLVKDFKLQMILTLVWLYLEKFSDNSHFHWVKCSVIYPPSKQWCHCFPEGTRRRRHFGCGTVFWGMDGVESRANSNPVTFVFFRFSEVSKILACFRTMACFSLVNTWTVSPEICTLVHCQTTLTQFEHSMYAQPPSLQLHQA